MRLDHGQPALRAGPSRFGWLTASVAVCTFASALQAQDARVYSANSSNGRIQRLEFDPPSATTVNSDENQRVTLRAIAIREDGVDGAQLIACDTQAGEVVFYAGAAGVGVTIVSAAGGGPTHPDGVSLDPDGNLALVTSGPGNAQGKTAQVWVVLRDLGDSGSSGNPAFPGGYRAPLGLLDSEVMATTKIGGVDTSLTMHALEETARVRATAGLLEAGDLLVVASDPPMLLRYRAAPLRAYVAALRALPPGGTPPAELDPEVVIHPPTSSEEAARRFPDGAEPGGVAFAPDGSLLIPVAGGDVLLYGPDGRRREQGGQFVDFADDLGNGKFKVAVGPQGGKFRAFLTNRNGGEVLRFTFQADGTGVADGTVTSGIESPVGIATTTSTVVPTPTGNDVLITPTQVLTSKFKQVVTAGVTAERVLLFADPREKEIATPPALPLHRSLFLNEISEELPPIEIPAYVRSFPLGDPDTGTPTFILVVVDTTAQLEGVATHFAEEATILGYEPDCGSADSWERPRIFWAPTLDEPPIVEGDTFIDVTDLCGSDRALTRNILSLFLPGARDTRDPKEIASSKFDGLTTLFTSSNCISKGVRAKLARKLDTATRSFERKKYADAATAIKEFSALVASNLGAFDSCSDSLGSELMARCGSLVFALGFVH